MKKTFLLIAMACLSIIAFAQMPTQRTCGTMDHHEYLKQTRPNYENDRIQYNQMLDQYLLDKAASKLAGTASAASTPTVIPVVVHVVYANATQSISLAQATSQVQVLNDDFAKLNTDASKVTQPTFSTVASGANIRFCLAQRDPNGNPTTGVVYKSTGVSSFSTNDAVKSSASGGDDPWDVTKYVNIWVCNLGGGILGYGEFPTGSLSNTWGLVLHYQATGIGGTAQSPYNLGRTGTHEFGHCFNLFHIWGDDNGACSGSDQCADTPNQANMHYGCYTAGSIQTDACSPSSPGTMWMNYMDYSDDACLYMFTAGQVARMEAVVSNPPWNVLATSNACSPPTALDAGISSILNPVSGSSSCNNTVVPKVTLVNAGSTTLTSASILYKMDAMATQTLNWSGSLATGASTVLTLNTYSGLTNGAHTFSVSVTNPNGGADGYAANNSMTSTFTITSAPSGAALPFTEGFESTTFPPTGWVKLTANTLNSANTWTRVANSTGLVAGSTAIAKMDNYSGSTDITGQLDALRTPALSFATANSSLKVKFDVSHRYYGTSNLDTLNVYISTDCGGTWTKLYGKGGTQLATVAGAYTSAYTPTANAQWRRDSISLSSYAGQSSVYLKFENKSGWGNNLYLDNINVSYTTAAAPPTASFTSSSTKCVGQSITFTDASTNSPTSWTWSFPGGSPTSSTAQNPTVTYTAAGTYTITHTAANSSGTSTPVSQTITVNALPSITSTSASICRGSSATLTAGGASTYVWNTGATTASISVSPTVATVYTVTGTLASTGCSNTRTTTVTIKTTPTVTASSKTVCLGSATTLTASGATSYTWNTGATTSSISVSPTLTTNYTVTGTNSVGCTHSRSLTVTVNPLPNVTANSATICAGATATLIASGASTFSWSTGSTSATLTTSPSSNTTYTVLGTSTAGCSKTITASVVVGAAPAISVNTSTICAGQTATLTASGVNTYTWSTSSNSPSIAVTPTATSVYTVSGNMTGCTTTAIKTTTVNVNQLPSVSMGTLTSPMCTNGPTVNLTGSPVGGTFSGVGVTGNVFNPASAGVGTFTITYNYTDANSCSALATRTVSVSSCTGIMELAGSYLAIYPNPAKDVLNISMDATLINELTTLELYDATGKLLISQSIKDEQTMIPLQYYASGIYVVRVLNGGKQVTKRIVKE